MSRWSEIHVRKSVEYHRERIHNATLEGAPLEAITDPLDQLRWARWLVVQATQLEEAAIIRARRAGTSWTTIGNIHGTTRQAAHQRWSHLDRDAKAQAKAEDQAERARQPAHNPPKKSRKKRRGGGS